MIEEKEYETFIHAEELVPMQQRYSQQLIVTMSQNY